MPPKKTFVKGLTVPMNASSSKKKVPPKRFTPAPNSTPPPKSGRSYLIVILIIAMLLSAAYLVIKGVNIKDYSMKKGATKQQEASEPQGSSDAEESILDRVKRHLVVDETETPYVATISNIDLVRARNPVFYKDASQGDKVLIWSDKAVIYSEDLDKLVAVTTAPLTESDATSTESMEGDAQMEGEGEMMEEPESVSIEIRNGSRVAGAASRLRASLLADDLEVLRIGDAANTYDGTRIIDLTHGKAASALQMIVDETAGDVTSEIPEGEPATDADILIIIGR